MQRQFSPPWMISTILVVILAFFLPILLPVSPLPAGRAWARQGPSDSFGIEAPLPGQAVQGLVTLTGSAQVEGFRFYQVAFAYAGDPTNTWFLIQESLTPVLNGPLAEWDTTTITDGIYSLRLQVTLAGGNQQTVAIQGIRVRNYTPIETDTPTPSPTSAPLETQVTPSATASLTPPPSLTPIPPSPTPFPPNPAEISSGQALQSLVKGVLAVFGLFAGLGVYYQTRHLIRKGRDNREK